MDGKEKTKDCSTCCHFFIYDGCWLKIYVNVICKDHDKWEE